MRTVVVACLLGCLFCPAALRAQVDHLEVFEAPRLVDCGDSRPYFRMVVNAVDAQSPSRPVGVGLTPEQAKTSFHVTEGDRDYPVRCVGLFEGNTPGSKGNYVMLLLDTSGSMNQRVPGSNESRFVAAKGALRRSLANFAEGEDHIAVVPFDSHNVVTRIRSATFQSTRQGVQADVDALAVPKPNNDTALYTAISEALPILKRQSDAGYLVSLVVFSDGQNDVANRGNDPGLMGSEGLDIVKGLAAEMKVPVTTVGFGVSGNAALVSVLRQLAFPSADSYYDAATDPQRLDQILTIARQKMTDRIQILFGPVRDSRDSLAGRAIPFRITLRTPHGPVSTRDEAAWNPPLNAVPVFEAKCSAAEVKCIVDDARGPKPPPPPRLMVLGLFIGILAAMWFGAPRLVWPESYVPKPTYVRPTSGVSEIDALRPSSFSGPRGATPPPRPPSRGGPPPPRAQNVTRPPTPPRQPMPGEQTQTVVIPPRGGARPPAAASPRPARPEPSTDRTSGDETIYRPPDKGPKRDG